MNTVICPSRSRKISPRRRLEISERIDLDACAPIQTAVREAEGELNGAGRVLLRPSGTEPLVRVMVEGRDLAKVEAVARQLAEVVRESVAAGGR